MRRQDGGDMKPNTQVHNYLFVSTKTSSPCMKMYDALKTLYKLIQGCNSFKQAKSQLRGRNLELVPKTKEDILMQ